ncbi:hypothetical protein PsorP6_014559 [Peronosclerospora sorghi]|uniref:Uncharacterized protein n=1 Tax=Peronosclerospora sorghi TaxID=230839 RepID=A0ACC0VRS9_9STRA|nr:hypothetical protein PsorP6_014559 [Peronosclerospora sorghi]
MSRSALTRHALQKSLRGQATLDQPPEETHRHVKQDELPIYGNDTTYNLNTLLHENILQSAYFHELYRLRTYHEVVDEIYYRVDHAEPWSPGTARTPSTGFCLLHKFFLMRLTVKQMQGLLRHKDSPYIRVIGFLYLRYTCDPAKLWTWFEPYLDDPEAFNAAANPSLKTTMGDWLVRLLEENTYFGTILPRIPKKIEDGIKVKVSEWEGGQSDAHGGGYAYPWVGTWRLRRAICICMEQTHDGRDDLTSLLLVSRKKERARENLAMLDRLQPGTKVRAMYADEENEPAMYDAVIDAVEEGHYFWVTFPAYGNTEKVSLGDIELGKTKARRPPRSSSRSRSRSLKRNPHDRGTHRSRRPSTRRRSHRDRSRSRGRHRSRSTSRSLSRDGHRRRPSRSASRGDITGDLLQQVRERERRKAEAVGRDYASRPASYKGSLSLKLDRWTTRKRSRSPAKREEVVVVQPGLSKARGRQSTSRSPEKEKTRETHERLQKLRELYGDASTKPMDG